MSKNIWALLTAALFLNVSIFAADPDVKEDQEDGPKVEENAFFAADSDKQDSQPEKSEDETKVETLVVCDDENEQTKNSFLATDESKDETSSSFIG